jgi:hypothetical protein
MKDALPFAKAGGQTFEPEAPGERAIMDCEVDARDVLMDDPPGAEVEMPDLGIPHLPGGQPHVAARAREPGARPFGVEAPEGRDPRELDGVARARSAVEFRVTPTVENHEKHFSHRGKMP